jgi:hypothetical protein
MARKIGKFLDPVETLVVIGLGFKNKNKKIPVHVPVNFPAGSMTLRGKKPMRHRKE